jgi:hypothetical protein
VRTPAFWNSPLSPYSRNLEKCLRPFPRFLTSDNACAAIWTDILRCSAQLFPLWVSNEKSFTALIRQAPEPRTIQMWLEPAGHVIRSARSLTLTSSREATSVGSEFVAASTGCSMRRTTQKIRVCVYDQGLLCAECDGLFSPAKNYAKELLDSELEPVPLFRRSTSQYRSPAAPWIVPS